MVSRSSTAVPERTVRQGILQAAFEEFHLRGYQGGSINHVINTAGTTKGALFHHFDGKKALGLAVLDEMIRPMIMREWVMPLEKSDNPIPTIMSCIEVDESEAEQKMRCGCPLSNLAHEMSPLDEEFRQKMNSYYSEWRAALEAAFDRGKAAGNIRDDVDSATTSAFVVAAFNGIVASAKNSRDYHLVMKIVKGLHGYLTSLQK